MRKEFKKYLWFATALLFFAASLLELRSLHAQNSQTYNTNGVGPPTQALNPCDNLGTENGSVYADTSSGIIWNCNYAWIPVAAPKVYVTSGFSTSSFSMAPVPSLGIPVAANTNYGIECYISYQVASTSTVPQINFTGPASPTAVTYHSDWQTVANSTTVPPYETSTAAAFGTSQGASNITGTTNLAIHLHLGLINGPNAGTVQLNAAAPVGGPFTINPTSWCAPE
jgi:hypothetical protein